MPNLVFYDFETCSSNVSYGQIIQAAAVLVNDNIQELYLQLELFWKKLNLNCLYSIQHHSCIPCKI